MATENDKGCGSQSPDLGDMWKQGCPKSLEWISSCSTSETSCGEEYEHDNECQAVEVIRQDLSSDVVALFLEDWELGRVALSCRMNMNFFCQERRDACWDSPESLGSPFVPCDHSAREVLLRNRHSNNCPSLTVDGF